jgi:hypothetical protein
MNQEQVTALIRPIVVGFLTFLAAKGIPGVTDPGVITLATSVVGGAIMLAWAVWAHTNTSKIANAAGVDPEIKIQIPPHVEATSPGIAKLVKDNIATPNVTSTRTGY